MYLMSIIKNNPNKKKKKDCVIQKIGSRFVCLFFVKSNGYKRGTPKEEHTRKSSVITL